MDVISTWAAGGEVVKKMRLFSQVQREREITQKTDPGVGGGGGAVQEQPEGGDQERQVVSEGTLVSHKKQVQT